MFKKNIVPVFFLCWLLPGAAFSQSLQLMTYNIRLETDADGENKWSNRKEVFAAQLKFYEPDIVGMQECLPGQVNYLDSVLSNYKHIGLGREGAGKGESSPIFYNYHRLRLLKQATFWLSETPGEISKGWDASYLRVCTYALFMDRKTGRPFWVFNTHLDNNGELARVKSVELILKRIDSVNTKKIPVFFMGDFNTEPGTAPLVQLKEKMNDTRDVSLSKPYGPAGTFNNFEFTKRVTLLIDYIFISKKTDIAVTKFAVLSDSYDLKYPSDHLPVFIQVNFRKR
ncbi:MAG: endonuclease/exonuclease/phosphatase family protein [Sphingobacteriales bacterium]|nr:endonuclease/exonuclease/phosphatase family protein [Sphingobacteriales bacterium]